MLPARGIRKDEEKLCLGPRLSEVLPCVYISPRTIFRYRHHPLYLPAPHPFPIFKLKMEPLSWPSA